MYNTFLFWVAVASCVDVCFILAKDTNKNDLVISKPAVVDYELVDTSKHKEYYAYRYELTKAESKECRCENGKCMRFCDVYKNLNLKCLDKPRVCVCNPGFADISHSGNCKYCDCGQDFNCTFTWSNSNNWQRICECPEGYYVDKNHGDCVAECNDENPCRNGGTCFNQMCICPYSTGGSFCEEIIDCSDCPKTLEVNCLYDRKLRKSYCSCRNNSLHYDYDAMTCLPCQCGNGHCENDNTSYYRRLKCKCNVGYKEFNGYCKECNCGFGVPCKFDRYGKKICTCTEGFYEREGRCLNCKCIMSSYSETKCEVVNNKKRCFCEEGYQDMHGYCQDIDECEVNNPCHPWTTCKNIPGSFRCQCPTGYEGDGESSMYAKPGEICRDINECKPPYYSCWFHRNSNCTNLPGSYKCECLPGYEPFRYQDEPGSTTCVEVSKSWVPAIIVIVTSVVLITVSSSLHSHLKERAARSN